MDENNRLYANELSLLKQKQYQLFTLYSTGLENYDQYKQVHSKPSGLAETHKFSIADLENIDEMSQQKPMLLESTGRFVNSQGSVQKASQKKSGVDSFGIADIVQMNEEIANRF